MSVVRLGLALVIAGCVLGAGACRSGAKRSHREGGAAPVEIINQPALPDAGAGRGGGPSSDEIEPNDGDEVATPLPLGGTVRGKIDPETDVDHYRIDVDKPGALQVTVSGIDGVDLALEVEDGSGTVIARSDRGGARIREGVPNLGVTPGRYTAVVRAVPKKKPPKPAKGKKSPPPAPAPEAEPAKPAPVYEITATLVPAGDPSLRAAEHEPDDDRGTANDLIVGDVATGYIGWTGDADVWKLSVEALAAQNAIDLEVTAVEGVALELELADGIGQPLLDRKAPRGAPLIVRGVRPVVGPGAPPFHYVTIRGDRSNPETAYQLRVVAHVIAADAEIEPDDTLDKPYAVPPDRTIVHATWSPGDVDCFALPVAPSPQTVDATIDPKADIDLAVELVVDGKPIAQANRSGRGGAEKVTGAVPAGAHAVIRVRGADPVQTAEGAYDLSVAQAGAGDNAP